jgi:hypothetical protein
LGGEFVHQKEITKVKKRKTRRFEFWSEHCLNSFSFLIQLFCNENLINQQLMQHVNSSTKKSDPTLIPLHAYINYKLLEFFSICNEIVARGGIPLFPLISLISVRLCQSFTLNIISCLARVCWVEKRGLTHTIFV